MPLFKGKGCKSTPNQVIKYITDNNKAAIITSQNLNNDIDYATQFKQTADIYNKGTKFSERKYYHFKLSCNRADEVTAQAHHEYAEAMSKELFAKYECVIATHTDTNTIHSHIVVNAISFESGKKMNISDKQYNQMKDIANKFGADRGFTELIYNGPNKKQITRTEREIILKGGTSWKAELREIIDLAKKNTSNIVDFKINLEKYGIEITRNTDKTIAFKHPNKEKAIRGEKLGSDYTKGEILNGFIEQKRKDSNRRATGDMRCENERSTRGETRVGVSSEESTKRDRTSKCDNIEYELRPKEVKDVRKENQRGREPIREEDEPDR